MREFRIKRNFIRLLYTPIAIVALGILLFFLARAAFGVYMSEVRSRNELENTERQAQELQSRGNFLSAEVDKLSSPRGIEEELRGKFPVVKEGENMVILVGPAGEQRPSATADEMGFWASVVNFFK